MARTVPGGPLATRSSRLRLDPRHEPYWHVIAPGAHLGYRRGVGETVGVWWARYRAAGSASKAYAKASLRVTADDVRDANGLDVLSFADAQEKARAFFDRAARKLAGAEDETRLVTVADAVEHYLQALARRGRRDAADARAKAARHILPKLGGARLDALSRGSLQRWLDELAASPALGRTGKARKAPQHRTPEDLARSRKATANRIWTLLRAVLNEAWREAKAGEPSAWQRVRPFGGVDQARVVWLSEEEARRLLNACASDFRLLVRAALLTGLRYGELVRLRARDFQPQGPSLFLAETKAGKARHAPLDHAAAALFAELVKGKAPDDVLLVRADGTPWSTSEQARPMKAASKAAKISPPATFHALRHSFASQRIQRGAPLVVVAAALGHADSRMVEKHYGHLAPGFVKASLDETAPDLGSEPEASNVVALAG